MAYLSFKKKIYERWLWTSTEVEPSTEIQIHKSQKVFKFNFTSISDSLAEFQIERKKSFKLL